MSVSVFCMFLSACGGQGGQVTPPELANKTEVSTESNKKSSVIVLDTLKAFPTAMGAGAKITGGRGGSVQWVTTTNPKGQGSFYEALNCDGVDKNTDNKTIMFAVGGSFVHDYHCYTDLNNFSIAGQTANDLGGFHLDNSGNDEHFFYADSENGVWRYISIRGNRIPPTYDGDPILYTHGNGNIFDHITDYGGNSSSGPSSGVGNTVQYNLATESNNSSTQNTGYQTFNRDYSGKEGFSDYLYNASILKSHRIPSVSGSKLNKFRVINNYNYGWGTRHMVFYGSPTTDTYNNVFEEQVEWANYNHVKTETYSLSPGDSYADGGITGSYYFDKNWHRKHDFSELFTIDNKNIEFSWQTYPVEVNLRKDKLPGSPYLMKLIDNPTEVKDYVLKNAGAGVRYKANGVVENVYSWEVEYINYARNGNETGTQESRYHREFIPNKSRNLTNFERRQGFPKAWATKHGLDINDSNIRNKVKASFNKINDIYTVVNSAGYTNLEIYLAELAGDFHMLANK